MSTLPETQYGSDAHGLVWGYLFCPGQPAQVLASAEAALVALEQPAEDGAPFVWLHFSLSNSAAEPWIRRNLALPDAFVDGLHETAPSTRLEQDDGALLAVLHDVIFEFSSVISGVSTVNLCVQPHLLLTARRKPLRSVDRLRGAVKSGEVFHATAELLAHLLRDQAEVLAEIVRQSTTKVDAIEDAILEHRPSVTRAELGALRKLLVRLQRLLAPEPAALFRLLSKPPGWVSEESVQDLQHAAEEFAAAVADSAALVDRVKLLQEELVVQINERTGRILFVLTVVTVLALPINLVAGLFGMNVGGIPLAEVSHGFALVVGVLVAFTAVVGFVAARLMRR